MIGTLRVICTTSVLGGYGNTGIANPCDLQGFMKSNRGTDYYQWWKPWFVLLPLLLSSCVFNRPPMILKSGELPYRGDICRIAVLPFSNQTDYKRIETVFGRIFVSELIEKGSYLVAHEGDVRRILTQMGMLVGSELSSEQIRGLADRLGAQVVISGSILETRDDMGLGSDPSLAVVVRLLEASTGRTVWITYARSTGKDYRIVMHFGGANSLSALAKRISADIIDKWEKEGFKKCTE